jgi:hypothetical protein
MSTETRGIAERTRIGLGDLYLEMVREEEADMPPVVSPPDLHVAMMEGAAQFLGDIIAAGRDGGAPIARRYIAEYLIDRMSTRVEDLTQACPVVTSGATIEDEQERRREAHARKRKARPPSMTRLI